MFSASHDFGGSILSVASVDSTVAYLINKVQSKHGSVQCKLLVQGFNFVVVYLQRQFPHHRTFSRPEKWFVLRYYEDHLFEELAKHRCHFIGIFNDRPVNIQ